MGKDREKIEVKDGCIISAELRVCIFQEDGIFHAYCPSLDMFGYGNSVEESQESFDIVFEEYVRYTAENGTLEQDLKNHGWRVECGRTARAKKKLKPPKWAYMLAHNKELMSLTERGGYQVTSRQPSFQTHC